MLKLVPGGRAAGAVEGMRVTQYSHSRLSSFENCPRQFAYRYVEKIETRRESIEAFTGKRVHEILERLYHHVGRHGKPPSLSQVLSRFGSDWRATWHDEVGIVRKEFDVAHYQQLGARCLENYYRRYYPFDGEETVGIETRVQFSLDPAGRYKIRGVADRVVRSGPGRYEIHDYKTGRRLPNQQQLDTDRQLALYQIGLAEQYPDQPVRLVWHYLRQNQSPTSTRTPEQLETLRSDTMHLIDRIRTEFEYKPKRSGLCDWCEYNDRCPIYPNKAPARRSEASGSGADTDAPPPPSKGQLRLFSSDRDHS